MVRSSTTRRGRRGHDAPEAAAIRRHGYAERAEPLRAGRVEHGADRLRRRTEGRVAGVDLDLREERRHLAPLGHIRELLLEQVAEEPLALCADEVEGVRALPRLRLARGAVAAGDEGHVVRRCDRRASPLRRRSRRPAASPPLEPRRRERAPAAGDHDLHRAALGARRSA